MMQRLLRHLTFWKLVFAALMLFGVYALIVRFGQGLGAATNLSDEFPWGLWIGFDVLVGVGLAAGGFSIAATVHIFQLEHYKPVARPAVFTAFVGYLLVVVGLLCDLGQPWDIWHPLVMWNPRSVMFEVAWCVMLYTTVLALEFSPVVFDRFRLERPARIVRAIYIPLVVLGVLLSMMHQSSLGTLYVIVPDKLHGLWYTPLLPVFFFISALAAGLAMAIVESYLSHRAFGRELEQDLLQGLARVIVVLLAVYAVWRLQDMAGRGNLGLAFELTRESVMFWGEMGLGVLLPLGMMASARLRAGRETLFLAALLTVLGFIVNRMNVAITGMSRASGVDYFPSAIELGITAGLVAAGFAAFAYAAKNLALFPAEEKQSTEPAHTEPRAVIGARGLVALWILLGIGGVLYSWAQAREESAKQQQGTSVATKATAALGLPKPVSPLRLPEDYLFASHPDSPGPVKFSHEDHIDEDQVRCITCHHEQFSLLEKGKPLSGAITMKRMERGELCGSCHNGEDAFGLTTDDCDSCHEEE
jgi:c(7)-type cytochrome triheme protein